MSRPTRDGNAEPVSRDQSLRRERGQKNIHFPCSADHAQDWQPYLVDPYSSYICVVNIHIYNERDCHLIDLWLKFSSDSEIYWQSTLLVDSERFSSHPKT